MVKDIISTVAWENNENFYSLWVHICSSIVENLFNIITSIFIKTIGTSDRDFSPFFKFYSFYFLEVLEVASKFNIT